MPTPTFTTTDYSVSAKAIDLVKAALLEIGAYSQGETPSGADGDWGLQKLQRLIDQFNARMELIYNVSFQQFTLTANHSPHTIGPGGDFDIPLRPVRILAASVIINAVKIKLRVQDDDWWANQTIPTLTSTLPTNLYYSPDTPLGKCYFWPIPTQVNAVELEFWSVLNQAVKLDTAIAMPVGYWDAIVLSLAVSLCPSFERPVTPDLLRARGEALKAIEQNNAQSPRMDTRQAGMPGGPRHTRYNYLTGKPW